MDPVSLVSALFGARIGQLQMATAARMMRSDAVSAASVTQVIDAAQQNMNRLANVAAGVGRNLDITV